VGKLLSVKTKACELSLEATEMFDTK